MQTITLILAGSVVVAALVEGGRVYATPPSPLAAGWQQLESGLEFAIFSTPQASGSYDSSIRVLRIDPRWFEFRLLNASNPAYSRSLSARMWCTQYGLVAAINASMYQADRLTSVSLMRTRTHLNNSRLSRDKAVFAFDRQNAKVPLVKIIDRDCEDFEAWKDNYGTLVQSIRMISCKGRNVWSQQPQRCSTAAIGTDEEGRVLFIHVRFPFSTHDLINILLGLPLKLVRLMYGEGGSEAQLYVQSGEHRYEFTGTYESGFTEGDQNNYAWPIPNVVGITRRDTPLK